MLLEQLHKSNGEYTYEHYAADVNKLYEQALADVRVAEAKAKATVPVSRSPENEHVE